MIISHGRCRRVRLDGSVFCPDVEVFGGPELIRGAIPTRAADVLRPACRALPLVGRRRELDTLLEWLERGSACVRVVAGPAGAGKSRLLAEVAALSQRRFVVSNAIEASEAAQDGMPLVVMTRHMRMTVSDAEPVVIEALGAAERAELFEAACRSGASRRGRPAQPIRLAQLPDESPEALIMAGLIAPDIGASAAIAMAPEARAARIAAHEADALDELARQAGLDPWPVRHIAACLTHRGGASVDEAIRLVEREVRGRVTAFVRLAGAARGYSGRLAAGKRTAASRGGRCGGARLRAPGDRLPR